MTRSRSGYTLIELIVVVAIIGIVAGFAITRVDYLVPKYRLRAAAREMGATLKQARSKAASTGRDVYVRIRVSDSRYELLVPFEKENPAAAPYPQGTPEDELPPKEWVYEPVMARALPEGTRFINVITGPSREETADTGMVLVRVTPYGTAHHLIANFRLDDRIMALRMNGLTGTLTFFDEEKRADELLEDSGY